MRVCVGGTTRNAVRALSNALVAPWLPSDCCKPPFRACATAPQGPSNGQFQGLLHHHCCAPCLPSRKPLPAELLQAMLQAIAGMWSRVPHCCLPAREARTACAHLCAHVHTSTSHLQRGVQPRFVGKHWVAAQRATQAASRSVRARTHPLRGCVGVGVACHVCLPQRSVRRNLDLHAPHMLACINMQAQPQSRARACSRCCSYSCCCR